MESTNIKNLIRTKSLELFGKFYKNWYTLSCKITIFSCSRSGVAKYAITQRISSWC
nr:MAG TPA: hypothetical protein [Bacteriophage sp.]